MKQVLIRQGRVVVEEMPAPSCAAGEVLVRTAFSLISAGTETTTLQSSAEAAPPVTRWTNRFRKVGEVLRMVANRGVRDAGTAVAARLEGPSQVTGYSLAGTVLSVGSAVTDLVPGQRVACAGSACAHHGEIVAVPRNLVVAVPAGLSLDHAASVTLGAIALQGVRQADCRLGEVVCVIGLGLIGQLTVALVRAAGCRVIGSDPDAARVERAGSLGLEAAVSPADLEGRVDHLTSGRGADAAIVTASAGSSEPTRQAVRCIRRRGRVVVVGAVGMDIDRNEFYAKDAELKIASSYGPGRHDPSYERDGRDYPFDYVRWTENRNMAEFLRLAATGTVPLGDLLDRRYDIHDAAQAFDAVGSSAKDRALGVLLRYPAAEVTGTAAPSGSRVDVVPSIRKRQGLGVALIGPGHFARDVHLPNLRDLEPAASLRAVVGRTANSAREAARSFAGSYATTDLDEVLQDDSVDVVLICTRHDLHAVQAEMAIRAGKAVFCEKPAALDPMGLERLEAAVREAGSPFTVGFNRRFAPLVLELGALLGQRSGPVVLDYRVNAGRLPEDHWTLGAQGGGRFVGEACHMVDLMTHLIGHPVVDATLKPLAPPPGRSDLPLGDNVVLACRHGDGSLSVLTYTSLGHPSAGKERVECHWDGRSAVIEDFRRLTVLGIEGADRALDEPDKGHAEMLRRFIEHAAGKADAPIPLDEVFATSRLVVELDLEARGIGDDADDRGEQE